MRFAARVGFALALTTVSTVALAVRTPDWLEGRPELHAPGRQVRAFRDIVWDTPPAATKAAWSRFLDAHGHRWRAYFDRATGVPGRILGEGIPVPGAMASDWIAERAARDLLAQHLDLLAPGASPDDFVLASNHTDGAMRSVGFYQMRAGMRVLGGQVSFRFKNDRLFVIGSEAIPFVAARTPARVVPAGVASDVAEAWIRGDFGGTTSAGAVDGPFVLPLVGPAGVLDTPVVVRVRVDSVQPIGRWDVYLDAATGAPIARRQTLRFATGTVTYNTPVRWPGAARMNYPAAFASMSVDGANVTSDAAGAVMWSGAGAASLTTRATGAYVNLDNAAGAEVTGTFTLAAGGSVAWNLASSEFDDAQLTTFVHATIAKLRGKIMAPGMTWLDGAMPARVNINDTCNAYSDGDSINMFRAGGGCANTGRLADVVYHEFGHSFHAHAIIPGVGDWGDGSLGEGVGDYFSATITGDPAMGRGFFNSEAPLRHIDPPGDAPKWPDDIGEIHTTGIIYAATMWDLRQSLVAQKGEAEGVAWTDHLYYQAIRRAVDIPSTYAETLAADDDDGNIDNGTPHACLINAAFAAHGLAMPGAEVDPGIGRPLLNGWHLEAPVSGGTTKCPGKEIATAVVNWKLRDQPQTSGTVPMAMGATALTADLPPQPDGSVVNYQVVVTFADGSGVTYPDNPADPFYELFVGHTVPIYCTDFEGTAAPEGWTHGLQAGTPGEGADDWQWGMPAGTSGSGDPKTAYSGQYVYGNDLGGGNFNGKYQANKTNWLRSPEIDASQYQFVRLQYRRWLNVEDGVYDRATIYANEEVVWTNLATDMSTGTTHHTDREWRFHDVDLTPRLAAGKVQVKFELESDGGLEMGGWTIDDFCVVGYVPSVCGDGQVTGAEECDDGPKNSDTAANACRTTCRAAHCGDGVVDSGEQCDDANGVDGDECSNACRLGGPLELTCGNGVIDDGEQCDDGNDVNDDECTNACRRPPGFEGDGGGCGCRVGARTPAAPAPAVLALAVLAGILLTAPRRRR